MIEDQSGYLFIAENHFAARLSSTADGKVSLEVSEPDGNFVSRLPEYIEIAQFRSSKGYFTLIHLNRRNFNTRFGVASLHNFSVIWAISGANFTELSEISSAAWALRIEHVEDIVPLKGLSYETKQRGTEYEQTWHFDPPTPVVVYCESVKVKLTFRQKMFGSPAGKSGFNMKFSYPIDIDTESALPLQDALVLFGRIRKFFSMIYGKPLNLIPISLKLFDEEEAIHHAYVHAFNGASSPENPRRPIVRPSVEQIEISLNKWLGNYDQFSDALNLHMQGLDNSSLHGQLQFQLFTQAIEGLHRRTTTMETLPVDTGPVREALQRLAVPETTIKRVIGLLETAHEPGIRPRLNEYFSRYQEEIHAINPIFKKREFVKRTVATRNHFAHRTIADKDTLTGTDLWDYKELAKCISHLALLSEMEMETKGVGKAMKAERFSVFFGSDTVTEHIPAV